MKKWIIPAICAVCAVFLIVTSFSGHKGAAYVSIGSTYNKFLFIPAKSAHFNITFKSAYTGNLTLIDDKGNTLPSGKYTITVNGRKTGPSFYVKDKNLVHVAIRCSKLVSPGKHYIRVKGGGPLITHVYFKHHLNPLVVWLSWIITLFAVVALLWFLLIRKICYPQFKSCQKTFIIPQQSPIIVKMKGARMVVLSAENKKQSFWDALLKGHIIYKVHPAFTVPVILLPGKKGRILVKADTSIYHVSPNPIPYIGNATIVNNKSNINIIIN